MSCTHPEDVAAARAAAGVTPTAAGAESFAARVAYCNSPKISNPQKLHTLSCGGHIPKVQTIF